MSDPRFARLKTDPRFRRLRKHKTTVEADDRFNAVFHPSFSHKNKSDTPRVDKYGRPVSKNKEQDNLRKLYHLENIDESFQIGPDYARGEVLLESSDDSEDESNDEIVTIGAEQSTPITASKVAALEVDLDEATAAALDAQVEAYNRLNPVSDQAPTPKSHRLAVVNLDWEHVRAAHLYKVFSSLLSSVAPKSGQKAKGASNVARGKVLSVRVYPSEFGVERMAKEEKEGPPPEIFKRRELGENDINASTIHDIADADADYDEDALRTYQLERLRYYYAIVTCDTVEAANHLYTELDGTELERSANVLDLSFVPDDMTFEHQPRDEATENIATLKPLNFVTDALRHSKVKLTWDEDDPERMHVTRRALTQKDIDEDDFRALVASSSESENDEEAEGHGKSVSRDRLRALLLGHADELPEGWGEEDDKEVDMEITFTPGLTSTDQKGESTLDQYQHKLREKRKKRKQEQKERKEGAMSSEKQKNTKSDDDFFEVLNSAPAASASTPLRDTYAVEGVSDEASERRHFDMKAVIKSEKAGKRGSKRKQKVDKEDEVQEDFAIDVNDERFAILHEDHSFAIDPSNPHFKQTKSMTALLEERSKRQRQERREASNNQSPRAANPSDHGLEGLVERIKRKGKAAQGSKTKRLRHT